MLKDRVRNQKLAGSSLRKPEDVVRWFGAIQAQDYAGAKWALALRAPSITDRGVEEAFTAGTILRTHVLRPTWHFVTAAEIRWMVALNAVRLRRSNLLYAQRLELDAGTVSRSRRVIERALEGGNLLTRAEISAALLRARIEARGQRLAHLLFDLEQQAVICSGPCRGKQFTYALFSERVPPSRPLTRNEALATLAQRYFQSHGPATLRDFAWWSGLTMPDVRQAASMAGVEVLSEPLEPAEVQGATFLLPNYDEYLVAYRDRQVVVDGVRSRNLGVYTAVEHPHQIIADGRLAGSWRRTITDTSLTIEIRPYRTFSARQVAALGRQARRYGRFLGLPAVLQ